MSIDELKRELDETEVDTQAAIKMAWYTMTDAHMKVAGRVARLRGLLEHYEELSEYGLTSGQERDYRLVQIEHRSYCETLDKIKSYMGLE
jgi:hypothetical protein